MPMVEHGPISAKNKARLHQFGDRVPPGSFMGCVLYAGRIWNGDIFVADVEELQNLDASEIHARRLKAREVLEPKNGDDFIYSHAQSGTVNLAGKDQEVRTSIRTWKQLDRRENHHDGSQGEADGSDQAGEQPTDHDEARDDFRSVSGSYIYRHHVQPTF